MSWKDKDYDVGFGKPPISGQFKKGKSGNPNGRPKGTRNFSTDVDEVLSGKVTVSEHGRPKKVSSQMAVLMRLREKALAGSPRAMDRFLDMARQATSDKEAAKAEHQLSAAEEGILQQYIEDMGKPGVNEPVGKEEPEDE